MHIRRRYQKKMEEPIAVPEAPERSVLALVGDDKQCQMHQSAADGRFNGDRRLLGEAPPPETPADPPCRMAPSQRWHQSEAPEALETLPALSANFWAGVLQAHRENERAEKLRRIANFRIA